MMPFAVIDLRKLGFNISVISIICWMDGSVFSNSYRFLSVLKVAFLIDSYCFIVLGHDHRCRMSSIWLQKGQ